MNLKFKKAVYAALIFCTLLYFQNIRVYAENETEIFVNNTDGYKLNLPVGLNFDFSLRPIFIKAQNDSFYVTISKEESPYEDIDKYIDYYLNRFILSEEYQKSNNITFKGKVDNLYGENKVQVISVSLNGLSEDKFDGYTYATIKTDSQTFFRIMFKYHSQDKNAETKIEEALSSFNYFEPDTSAYYNIEFKPILPQMWSEETLNLYNSIYEAEKLKWGIYTNDITKQGIDFTIPEMEQKLEFKFPIILSYLHFGTEFPMEFMNKSYEQNRIVELTYQITQSNNNMLFDYTPNLDIYRGLKDEEIRKFAKSAKEFGHPFLFRLNNEVNTDWTSYSGITNMSDPEIYVDNWRRFYKIFQEEGVNNAIWIYNPNNRDFPPCNWNSFLAYYPGNEYVQMIGVTGYNTGTYYKEEMDERWSEFDTIYRDINNKFFPFFDKFPWIITEFSSSSIGGDKAKWIKNMFKNIDQYKNIKVAVWFSFADYDYRDDKKFKVARPYWLDETPETLEEFKQGLKDYR